MTIAILIFFIIFSSFILINIIAINDELEDIEYDDNLYVKETKQNENN